MEKLYEKYGIPSVWKYNINYALPDYVTVIDFFSDEMLIECGEAQVDVHTIRLWGQAEFWTPLEAALLLAGIPPDDEDLYAVSIKNIVEDDFSDTEAYIYKFSSRFCHARDYFFLFERSSLAPKSTPLDWVTYFKKTIMPPHLFFEPSYCLQWLNFFRIELNEGDFSEAKNLFSEKNKTDKPLNNRTENNYLRLIFKLANGIQGFNSTKPYEAAKLIIDETGIENISRQTIADFITKAHALDSKEKG